MGLTLRKNFGRLADTKFSDRALMREVGLLLRERIQRRTLSGKDEDNRRFTRYSAAYATRKQAELGSATVNLQVSGRMLQGIIITKLGDDFVELGFKD